MTAGAITEQGAYQDMHEEEIYANNRDGITKKKDLTIEKNINAVNGFAVGVINGALEAFQVRP